MTALIKEMMMLPPPEEALQFHWFDMSAVYKHEQMINGEIISKPLPFPRTALVCAYEDKKVLFLINRVGEVTGVVGWWAHKHRYEPTVPFTYISTPEGDVKVRHLDGTQFDVRDSSAVGMIAFIAVFIESLDVAPVTGYKPNKRANFEKKIRQGKTPSYDWTTVVIEPSKPKNEPLGGTHASPRWHERRGHWRNTPRGKRVWVKNCEVGNKALGAVFHDYKLEAV